MGYLVVGCLKNCPFIEYLLSLKTVRNRLSVFFREAKEILAFYWLCTLSSFLPGYLRG